MSNALQGQLFGPPIRTKHAGEARQSMVSQATRVMLQSESNEWYTSSTIAELARLVLGGIDLDPASCPEANETIGATKIYTIEDNGLRWQWHGRVFLNPPYGKTAGYSTQGIWLRYLIYQYQKGNVSAAVCVTRVAVGYDWFSNLWRLHPICITDKCVKFKRPAGAPKPKNAGKSKTASALWYFGRDVERFEREFGRLGRVLPPEVT